MILRQITHDDLGCASYLIGDEKAGVAAVVDPKLEIEEYLRLARYARLSDLLCVRSWRLVDGFSRGIGLRSGF